MLKFVEICRKTLRIVEKVENYQKMSNNVQVWVFFLGGGMLDVDDIELKTQLIFRM